MEFEIKGNAYRIAKLSVFDQFKVSRKLLPVLSGMFSDFQAIKALAEKRIRPASWKGCCRKLLSLFLI